MSSKQQRRPLPSLLSLSFFYGIYTHTHTHPLPYTTIPQRLNISVIKLSPDGGEAVPDMRRKDSKADSGQQQDNERIIRIQKKLAKILEGFILFLSFPVYSSY